MADWYVRSGATGSGTGANWANAKTTFAAAISAAAAGDRYLLSDDHNESTAAALTLGFHGTSASPDRVLCVNHLGSVPPVAADLRTTANVKTTGSNALTIQNVVRFYGVNFTCGNSTSTANLTAGNDGQVQTYENCSFALGGTGANAKINLGGGRGTVRLINCTVSFGAVSHSVGFGANVHIVGPAGSTFIQGATIPTNLFANGASTGYAAVVSGLDLSNLNTSLYTPPNASQPAHKFVNCKFNSGLNICNNFSSHGSAAFTNSASGEAQIIGCDSGGGVERNEIYNYMGVLTTETTIVRSGGAVDPNSTAYSWKIATSANNEQDVPFVTFEGAIWNNATGVSKSLTVHLVNDGVTLTNADIWLEVDYLSDSGSPITTRVSSGLATVLTTAANLTSDSGASWTTTGLTSPVKQEMQVSFTPQLAGPVRWRVKCAKASGTIYVCPKAELT